MDNLRFHLRRIATRHGLVLALALTGFFLLMRAIGLGHDYWMRALNFIFVFGIVYSAIRSFKNLSGGSYYEEFFDLFKTGILTSMVGIGFFAVFLLIYLGLIDHAFMAELEQMESFGGLISPVSVAFLIFLEGMGSSFVCSYLAIQLLKSRTVDRPVESQQR